MRPASTHLEVARDLALQAAERITTLLQTPLVRERKADHSIVTNADHEADRIIRNGLRKAFPDHTILTEESGLDGPADARFIWVVDPIDGTKAYAAGKSGYSVMIGLLENGVPCAGAVVDPVEGHLYEAVRGEGAYLTVKGSRKRIHVSSRDDLSKMPTITSSGFPEALARDLRRRLTGPWSPAVHSVGVKVGYLARQEADIYINHQRVHYWDTCAPQIILEEAGGVITFWDGKSLNYSIEEGLFRHRDPTLATNGLRQKEILKILQSSTRPLS
jgi:3'(2'), 5'-bisphosphate nucleotidase